MPIYEYQTEDGRIYEHICKYEDRPEALKMSDGSIAYRKDVVLIAKTNHSWGDSQWGQYDPDLGCVIQNHAHREKVMKEKGVRPVEDFGGVDRVIESYASYREKVKDWAADRDSHLDNFKECIIKHDVVRDDGTIDDVASARAHDEWMPIKAIESGQFDHLDPI